MDLTFVILVIIISTLIYIYKRRGYTYWERKGVPYIEPKFFYGNAEKLLKMKISYANQFLEYYREFKARGVKHGGVYVLFNPVYIPLDVEIIKCILQKDFDHFPNRGMYVNEETDPLSGHLFNLEGSRWRNIRVKLTPTFTSGKMKMMFQTLVECCKGLEEMLSDCSDKEEPLDVKDILGRFTTDIIGSCAFGLECNSMKNPDAEFRKYGKKIFEVSTSNTLKQIVASMIPKYIIKKLGVSFTDKEVEHFFIKAVKDIIEYRQKNNVSRKDFLQLLLQLMNTGDVSNDNFSKEIHESSTNKKPHLTLNEIAAQCFVFFAAGFETSSTTLTFALYELSINPDVQEKLRDEILSVLERNNNGIPYESISEMVYLENVFNETLRKYPPVPVLHRVCDSSYVIPGTNVVLEKRRPVQIPVIGLHYDSDYYPDPETFNPDRFNEENSAKRPAFTFLPFGEGPRLCIGLRFGKLQTKLGLITILKNYKISLNRKTKTPIQLDKKAFILGVEGGVWLNFSKLKSPS